MMSFDDIVDQFDKEHDERVGDGGYGQYVLIVEHWQGNKLAYERPVYALDGLAPSHMVSDDPNRVYISYNCIYLILEFKHSRYVYSYQPASKYSSKILELYTGSDSCLTNIHELKRLEKWLESEMELEPHSLGFLQVMELGIGQVHSYYQKLIEEYE